MRTAVDTARMEWTRSPSASVWRKRVHLVGAPESGQVTSVVRFEPDAKFPEHDHPDGEEILVLEGVFSDEYGDWPSGTFLLNPEGFRHGPFSRPGCTLFVKLRQCPGRERRHVAIDAGAQAWKATGDAGIARKILYEQSGFSDVICLERWQAGTEPGVVRYTQGAEMFVLEGAFADEEEDYGAGHWLRFPVGCSHRPRSAEGCILYVKRNGLSYLKSG